MVVYTVDEDVTRDLREVKKKINELKDSLENIYTKLDEEYQKLREIKKEFLETRNIQDTTHSDFSKDFEYFVSLGES